jgi:molybdopterin molybdotransferase
MLSSAEALDRILAAMPALPAEHAEAVAATGRVLRQTVVAERDQPPFDRVMMDGIAIRFADVQRGTRAFTIQGRQMAGEPARRLDAAHCIEIMTGAALPPGADCIVPVERINVTDGVAVLEDGYEPAERQFIHARASDYAKGDELLKAGRRIAPMDIAVIASSGLADIDVSALPVVRIISTGDELVPAGRAIAPHEIRLSNGPAIASMLASHGYVKCEQDHLADDRAILEDRIAAHLEEADVVILSGGVSMGKADYVPEVLANLGVEVVFHKVAQRPGKPMWFGTAPGNKVVFALPGNPVSALVCCRHYVIPALAKASRSSAALPEFASLASDVTFEPDLTCFQPVRLVSNAAGQVLALPVKTNTSGDFAALAGTDGYVELAREQTRFPSGTPVFLHRW